MQLHYCAVDGIGIRNGGVIAKGFTHAAPHHRIPPPELLIAASTPNGCVFASATGWPVPVTTPLTKPIVANALATLIETTTPDPEVLMAGLAVLLGKKGIAKQRAAARRIKKQGGLPMLVLLVLREEAHVTWVTETLALDNISVH